MFFLMLMIFVKHRCFFDIELATNFKLGRIVFELYSDYVPKAAANFLSLCKGDTELSYKNTQFQQIIPGYLCQGGNVELKRRSFYQENYEDNNFKLKHSGPEDGFPLGRMIIELYSDRVPKTTLNFLSLCKGDSGMSYQNSPFHCILPPLLCQTGDVVRFDGHGGMSIYGDTFPDENFDLKHVGPGILSMVSVGPNTNNSKFNISFKQIITLNNKCVVFGRLVKGFKTLQKPIIKFATIAREAKTAEDTREAKTGEDSRKAKPGEDSREAKPGEDSREAKTGEDSWEAKTGEDSREAKTGEDSREAKPGEDSREAKTGEDSREAKTGEDSREAKTGEDSR
uniref:PPIase cyclophilin-type domain-containing protein n=1 Tax=Timema genevievae TaxID=629358 RepID=A0A7R9PGW3_TIMGE|nr:unnamed protein product [Timema genevievae]